MGTELAVMAMTTAINIAQQRQQARAQDKMRRAAMNRQIEMQNERNRIQEKQQRDKQKQEQATARAGFGARGVGSAGGSAASVVDSIAARTDDQIADNQRLSDLGIEDLRANQRARERQSMLQTRNSIISGVVDTGAPLVNQALKKINWE